MGLAVQVHADIDRIAFPHRDPVRAQFDGGRWGFDQLEVVSVHVVNPIARPFSWSQRMRQQELEALEGLLAVSASTRVLVGDFNSSPAWPLYRRLARIASDGPAAAGAARRTWSYYPSTPLLLRIDHAFLQGARCVSSQVVPIEGSDHRGLIVDVEPAP
jgi:endonuclease/exonuclease/phosphatase (EEP) superfamily protein YafD